VTHRLSLPPLLRMLLNRELWTVTCNYNNDDDERCLVVLALNGRMSPEVAAGSMCHNDQEKEEPCVPKRLGFLIADDLGCCYSCVMLYVARPLTIRQSTNHQNLHD
jgi:hypothetical protein